MFVRELKINLLVTLWRTLMNRCFDKIQRIFSDWSSNTTRSSVLHKIIARAGTMIQTQTFIAMRSFLALGYQKVRRTLEDRPTYCPKTFHNIFEESIALTLKSWGFYSHIDPVDLPLRATERGAGVKLTQGLKVQGTSLHQMLQCLRGLIK